MADNRYRDEGGWRGERGRERSNSIFGDNDRERESYAGRGYGGQRGGEDRGFIERAGEEIRSWFGGDDDDRGGRGSGGGERYQQSHYGSQHGQGGFQGDYSGGGGQGGFGGRGDYEGGRQSFSGGGRGGERFGGPEHEHYRSWRDRQIAELDRDYEEYCRDRQQQFHSDFGSWRQSRQAGQTWLGTSASTGSSSGLMSGSGGTTGGGDEGGTGTGSTASSRTGALLGGETGTAGGETMGQDSAETEGTGGTRSGGRSRT